MNEFQRVIASNGAFAPPHRILEAIPEALRTQRPPRTPHSIVEELWHIVYWMDHFLRWAHGELIPYPTWSSL